MCDRLRLLTLALVTTATAAPLLPARAQYNCAGISEAPNTTLSTVVVASGLSQPDFVSAPPGDTDRIFIVERGGRIRIHKHGQSATTLLTFLDITPKVDSGNIEMGLLGLAFDPDYATSGQFWIYYTETVSTQIYSVIARYTVSANPDVANTAEVRLFRVAQPETNHKGGMVTFGPDGFLYISLGDGGGGGDLHGTCGNGQNRSVLLAKILRIDVRGVDPGATSPDCGLGGANYKIPTTNPFNDGAGSGFCDEIFAYGLRNPWRPAIDPLTGDYYITDVGENCTEEINWVGSATGGGQNFGWRQMEGSHCFDTASQFDCNPSGLLCGGSPPCHDPSITLPVLEYAHSGGACSVTGGFVYRGCKMPNSRGRYFYTDYCTGLVNSFVMSGGVPTAQQSAPSAGASVSSFGVDGLGELYLVGLGGSVRKYVPPFADLEVSGVGALDSFKLSKTGSWTWEDLFRSTDVPVSFYRVYRGSVGGPYSCVFKALTPSWPAGGDPEVPPIGGLFAYVVSAVDGTGAESRRGTTGSFNTATCP